MSEEQDAGSSAQDSGTTSTVSNVTSTTSTPEPEPKPEKKSKSKPAKAPDSFLICSNHCGFNTRWPKAQALKEKIRDKNNKVTGEKKEASEPYLCPQCDLNGLSGKLVPFG